MKLTNEFEKISLVDALRMAATRTLSHIIEGEQRLVAVFTDGLEIAWQSECNGPYSEVTPDLWWEPPTVYARNRSA